MFLSQPPPPTTSFQHGSIKFRHRALDRAFWLPPSRESRFQSKAITTTSTTPPTPKTDRPPQSLLDEIINSINFLAERALASVETGLLNAPPAQLGFGRPAPEATTANAKSKRKRKQPPPPEDAPDQPPLSPEEVEEQARAEIASGTHQLETLLCTSIDRNFDRFELYVMKNILCVRPEDRDWIRLGHYEGLNFDNLPPSTLLGDDGIDDKNAAATKKDRDADEMDVDPPAGDDNPDIPTVYSVGRLRRRLQASQKLNTLLVAEKARNDALLGELRRIAGRAAATAIKPEPETGAAGAAAGAASAGDGGGGGGARPPLAFLHDRGDLTQADAATPLTTTTAFSLSQMQALRALSTSLSSILPDLRAAPATSGGEGEGEVPAGAAGARAGGPRTWRKERVEYVESAARKHLESVRGLELGRDGEVRDGEWQGGGRSFGGGEVGALEGVVEMLDEGRGGGDGGDGGEDEEMGDDETK